jgi:hypothetical protein
VSGQYYEFSVLLRLISFTLVERQISFGRSFCLLVTLKTEAVSFTETFLPLHQSTWYQISEENWPLVSIIHGRNYKNLFHFHRKLLLREISFRNALYLLTKLHDVATHETVIFTVTTTSISNDMFLINIKMISSNDVEIFLFRGIFFPPKI